MKVFIFLASTREFSGDKSKLMIELNLCSTFERWLTSSDENAHETRGRSRSASSSPLRCEKFISAVSCHRFLRCRSLSLSFSSLSVSHFESPSSSLNCIRHDWSHCRSNFLLTDPRTSCKTRVLSRDLVLFMLFNAVVSIREHLH